MDIINQIIYILNCQIQGVNGSGLNTIETSFKYEVYTSNIQSMQLQQNLYSIYRLILKLPRFLLVAALVFLLFVACTQFWYMFNINNHIDISQCMFNYLINKNQRPIQPIPNNNQENTTDLQYIFLDQRTFLNIQLSKVEGKCSTQINSQQIYDIKRLPFMMIVSNQQMLYAKAKSKQYYAKHNIVFDKLYFPQLQIEAPFFAYFFSVKMQQNEIIIQSMRQSFLQLQKKFNIYKMQNGGNITLTIDELYMKYYQITGFDIHSHEINLFQQITINLFPKALLKVLFGIFMVFVVVFTSIFVGLFIRYLLIFCFSVFLIAYDKCFRQSWGWIHQYLVVFYLRFNQNRFSTVKMMVFFVFSTLGMYGLLTFGTYCIIKKIIYPILPLLTETYTQFYMKTFFIVQLFHYVMCRSRTALRYFPIFSFIVNYLVITICSLRFYGNMLIIININLTFQLIFFTVFILVEKSIQEQNEKGLMGEYCPSMNKPRMLFYAGYDISWEKTLPPIWTYFTRWFDYGYFSEGQKCLIEKDYQLLYGRMLGLNERQDIPQEDGQPIQQRVVMQEQPSNQMNLIQNDL